MSAIAAGLTFSCCKNNNTQTQKTCVCAGGFAAASSHNSPRPAEWDNTGKTGQVVTFLPNNDVVVELAALLPELGAAIRSSKGSRQHQIKPVAGGGDDVFPQAPTRLIFNSTAHQTGWAGNLVSNFFCHDTDKHITINWIAVRKWKLWVSNRTWLFLQRKCKFELLSFGVEANKL